MIDLQHPLAVLCTRLPWAAIEAVVTPRLAQPEGTEINQQAAWHRRATHRSIPDGGGCVNLTRPTP